MAQSFELGEKYGRKYFFRARKPPEEGSKDFMITVFYKVYDRNGDHKKIEIVRIDNAHGYQHMDRLFEKDEPKQEIDLDFWSAWKRIMDNWKKYAKKHNRNLG